MRNDSTTELSWVGLVQWFGAVELVAIAETDRLAANALHQAKLYPQAVFALQRAIEKTVKAVGVATR